MTDKPIIGLIGLGLMGHGMAKNILEKGYQLLIMGHRNRQPVEDLLSRGAEEVDTPAAMAGRADIIFLCVSGSPQVEELLRGKNGILATARAGLIVVDSSTSDPVSTLALAEELAAVGCRLADAPLGRTPKEAEAGTLDTMVGADEQTFAAIRPVIECWAGNIVHLGPVGNGHKMKLINNFISIGYGALYSEALAVCRRSGITPQQFHAVIGSSRMANGFYETFMKYVIDGDRDAHKFTLINAHKDMCYLANMATAAGAANFLGSVVKNYLSTAEAMGKGDHYLPMLADHVAAINGVSLTED